MISDSRERLADHTTLCLPSLALRFQLLFDCSCVLEFTQKYGLLCSLDIRELTAKTRRLPAIFFFRCCLLFCFVFVLKDQPIIALEKVHSRMAGL